MNKDGKPRHIKRNIVLAALLALLCIGAAELAACRWFEPELYETIVAPVRHAAAVAVDTGRAGLNTAAQFCRDVGAAVNRFLAQTGEQAAALWTELTTPKETPPVETDAPTVEPYTPASTTPPISELLDVDGKAVLTGGLINVTYFCQSDEQWKDQPYGTDTIGPYGCGPTAMAMAVASLTDTDTDPAIMAAWAAEHGYWARRSGSYNSIVMGTARNFGILAEPFSSREADDILNALWRGKMLVALVGPGHFTTGGHFILIRGATLSGEVLVADPNSLENSLVGWDPQIILDELSTMRDNGAPMWVLWTSDT